MQHIIKKQVINLSLDKKLDAFRIQQLVSNHYYNKIVPMLQQAFDAASNEEETISLDTLEIDMGIINEKEIEKGNWEELVFKKISEQLLPFKHNIPSQDKIKKKSTSLSISGQWIFYMQHGYLSWNVLQINPAWYAKVLEAFAADAAAIGNLRNLISRHPGSVKRIISQHPEFFLKALIETLTAENQDALLQIINELTEIISLSENMINGLRLFQKKEVRQKLWEQALKLAASEEKNLNPSKIAIKLLIKNYSNQKLSRKSMKDFLLKNNINSISLKQIREEFENTEKNKPPEQMATPDVIQKGNETKIDEEGIYVVNAGIVLLHVFLTHLFKNLQLVKEEKFVDASSHYKGLYLLHYLSTGNTKPEEHELAIPKLLCAFPLEEPVTNSIELSDNELLEADSLLGSAIQQWEVLKNTSPDGLREGFLQRKGKLFTTNGNLHLQVEASSIDVLLDQLPWNLSLVKLPWMTDILKVEWR